MRQFTIDFFKKSVIPMTETSVEIMDFLLTPKNMKKMIAASIEGKPALSGVVKELEQNFNNRKDFPIYPDKTVKGNNAEYRRNVGWMVKYVMGLNGYFPVSQARLSIHDSKFFSTSTVYRRDTSAPSEITVNETILVKINKEMPMKAIFLHRNDDPVYYDKMKAQCTEFKKIITTLATKRPVPCENRQICAALSVLLPCYCSQTITADLLLEIGNGERVPCAEFFETINELILAFCNIADTVTDNDKIIN